MAKRRYSKKGNKIEPAPMTITFGLPVGPGANLSSYIDLSQVASVVNRRFYRQGLNWAVAGFKFIGTATGELSVNKLPNTWVMSNAWEKGFRAWQKMNREAIEEADSLRPKFYDFKIYADAGHHTLGSAANLLPIASNPAAPPSAAFTAGQWDYSVYEIPLSNASPSNSATRDVVAVGANYLGPSPVTGNYAVSLIEGYAASRALPDIRDPNIPADALDASGSIAENWQSALFNEGTTQDTKVLIDIHNDNNQAPYPFENDGVHVDTMYPAGANQGNGMQFHDIDQITGTTVGGQTRMKGGNFPCGLIRIDQTNFSEDSSLFLMIELIPGNHRGYLCEPMTEM